MSRSRKRTPVFKYSSDSDRRGKQNCNQKFRKKEKWALLTGHDLPVRLDEVMSIYEFPSDGKYYWIKAAKKHMRK